MHTIDFKVIMHLKTSILNVILIEQPFWIMSMTMAVKLLSVTYTCNPNIVVFLSVTLLVLIEAECSLNQQRNKLIKGRSI